eukprot:gb/GEZJ01003991.1/.p1 GENE.gb/GEZJ01003991.1/~~gb/GEZJ01003991.1/.p1  ORF type:complete len:623 (-),score=85.42 gb/GEZJ01003991.1/:221-2089(-)
MCSSDNQKSSPDTPEVFDVLVVGSGISGLYACWRLLQTDPNLKIKIIDKANRIGGRLISDVVHFEKGAELKAEQGGMRFTFHHMGNLSALLLKLGLIDQLVPFPMNSNGNNRLYVRGSSFTETEAPKKLDQLFNLAEHEKLENASVVIENLFLKIANSEENAWHGVVPVPEHRTQQFWQIFRLQFKWDGTLLKDWSLWNLFSCMGYSKEFITMQYSTSGFTDVIFSEMNAGVAIQLLLDFPLNPKFLSLVKGLDTLPDAIAQEIGWDRIWLNSTLKGVVQSEGRLRLLLETLTSVGANSKVIEAENVILAVPRDALEEIFDRSSLFTSLPATQLQNLSNTLLKTVNLPIVKITLFYKEAWWGPDVSFGPNYSDLPMGMVYPFYASDDQLFAAEEYRSYISSTAESISAEINLKLEEIHSRKYSKPAAMTIYAEYQNVEFWKALQKTGDLFTSKLQDKHKETMPAASQKVVNEASRFFESLFDCKVPGPLLTSARIWSGSTSTDERGSDNVGYGMHVWGRHAEDDKAMSLLAQPIEGVNLFTCGEAYSDYQGWIEGALRSANLMLEKAPFHLKAMDVIYKEATGCSPAADIMSKYLEVSQSRIREHIDPNFLYRENEVKRKER